MYGEVTKRRGNAGVLVHTGEGVGMPYSGVRASSGDGGSAAKARMARKGRIQMIQMAPAMMEVQSPYCVRGWQ
jgi:hypothetical protein